MFIQTENTPNPATLKFLPGVPVMKFGTANYTTDDDAKKSPLATRLFSIEGVGGVYLSSDFITVTKSDDKDWEYMKPQVLGAIMEHFQSGQETIEEEEDSKAEAGSLDGTAQKIKELIETKVRPAVAQDGGDIVYKGFENGVVFVHMQGACSGCPSATATLKSGIENMLRHFVPEVTEVRAIN
ncbi:MAG: NifU family protein [Pseudomonadota bacterium]|nr:NifU family protein [Pseudomonadota bacterium]